MTPIGDIDAHYQYLLTCDALIDTRNHLPYFHSLPGDVLEIGCDVGNSTTAFLSGVSRSVTSIDINPACGDNFPGCSGCSKWTFIAGDSRAAHTLARVMACTFDVLYVDGAHDYETVRSDLDLYSSLVRPGGLILVHDVLCPDTFPGVRRAFDEFTMGEKSIREGSYGLGVIQL